MILTKAKFVQIKSSPQKLRLLVNLIRGKKVSSAINILSFNKKKGSVLIKKLLDSVIANAEHNNGHEYEKLFIKSIFVDAGPTMKRMMPRAKGRADRILKRTSNITVIVSNK